jgi:hypothetical protein
MLMEIAMIFLNVYQNITTTTIVIQLPPLARKKKREKQKKNRKRTETKSSPTSSSGVVLSEAVAGYEKRCTLARSSRGGRGSGFYYISGALRTHDLSDGRQGVGRGLAGFAAP